MGLLDHRLEFRPLKYQWAWDYWFAQQSSHWLHSEINMQKDIRDWKENLTDEEKLLIEEILKGFAQTECQVEDYWSKYVTTWFPVPEVKNMVVTFAAMESVHANAYFYLNETLGLTDISSFLEDEATADRLDQLINVPLDTDSLEEKALSVALFSALAEGVSLYGQFYILLSFRQKNMLKGISQQMVYSSRDEATHSEAGCKLFRVLIEENPHIWTKKFQQTIYDAFDLFLEKEVAYLDSIYKNGDIETAPYRTVLNFLHDRANRKLTELMLKPKYEVDKKLSESSKWFYTLLSGELQTDFFDNKETNYAEPNSDWGEDLF